VEDFVAELGATVGEALLAPTRIYVKACAAVLSEVSVKGIAHITGGGFFENIPRIMPEGLGARVERGSWEIPPLFGYIQERGGVSDREMFGTFNMGVGMVMVVAEEDADKTVELLGRAGERAARIGEAAVGEGVFL
jgi:phosphoribosylformylglycinamidine cyclo-ligase